MSESSDTSVASKTATHRARVEHAVARCVADKSHGDVVTRAELETWLSMEFPSAATRRDYQRLELLFASMKADLDRALLTGHKMALESERGGRWRIVLPSEQAALASKTAREMFSRGLTKAQAITSNVAVAQLTDAERVTLDDTSARLASIQMFARSAMARELSAGKTRR